MKIDMTTYKDRKERQIGMTTDRTSRPDKVLFFADPHFLFFNCRHTLHTLSSPTSHRSNQSLPKSAIFSTHIINYRLIEDIELIKNPYRNNGLLFSTIEF